MDSNSPRILKPIRLLKVKIWFITKGGSKQIFMAN